MKNKTLSLILMAAGSSTRFNHVLPKNQQVKKQWLRIHQIPLWQKVLHDLKALYDFKEIFIGADAQSLRYMQKFCDDAVVICGGASRAETLRNILKEVQSDFVFVSDVARFNIDVEVCNNLLKDFEHYDCSVPYIDCVDTILLDNTALNREQIRLIQTPQISCTAKLKECLSQKDYTDESTAMLEHGHHIRFIKGSAKMHKLTTIQDLHLLNHLPKPQEMSFYGSGIDIHPFEANKPMMLGGLHINSPVGFKSHSDGDVILHAIIDALLGASGGGDIGEWFPDHCKEFKNISSALLLEEVRHFVVSVGYEISHLDLNIIAQIPKINPHKKALQEHLSKLLHLPKHCINIKATTAEKMGFIGREEGICVMAHATLRYSNWKEFLCKF